MSVQRVGPEEAAMLVQQGWHHVDVRSVEEFQAGHPEGAYNVPFAIRGPHGATVNPQFLPVLEGAFGKEAPLILGCESGGRSMQAAQILLREGFSRVVDQMAGFGGVRGPFGQVAQAGWKAMGLPCATTARPGRSWDELRAQHAGAE